MTADNDTKKIEKTKSMKSGTDRLEEIISERDLPSREVLESELERVKYLNSFNHAIRETLYVLITVAAITVLVATLILPVLQIYGSSMTPTLSEGNLVVSAKGSDFEQGDIIAFYYEKNILIKRVIAVAGDWVDISSDGTVYVNSQPLDEPYIDEKSYGKCNIELPYQVPDGEIFVMGDHRSVSEDSRVKKIGCVSQEQIVGKVLFRIWPLNKIGKVN